MAIAKDYSGHVYGRLTALRREGDKGGLWRFKCECGAETVSAIGRVRLGVTKSCGCLAMDTLRERSTTHGHSRDRSVSPTLSSYRNAKRRCYEKSAARYPQYGGRGIRMCERWRNSFELFLEDMGERPEGMTLDRIDSDKDYEPGNCRWATPDDQSLNRRVTIHVDFKGQPVSLRRFAMLNDVPYKSLYKRVIAGQKPSLAVKEMKARKSVTVDGKQITIKEYAAHVGVNYKSLHRRMRRTGETAEVAASFMPYSH